MKKVWLWFLSLLACCVLTRPGLAQGQTTPPGPAAALPGRSEVSVVEAAGDLPGDMLPEIAEEEDAGFPMSGYFSLSYRARKRGSRNDEDIYSYLSIDGGRPEKDDVTFHVFGRGTLDLDGDARRGTSFFFSLNDVGAGNSFDFKLYEAYVDLRRSLAPSFLGLSKIRLGRQNIHAGYTYLMDGVRLDFQSIKALGNLRLGLFGGVPEFLYDSSRGGDYLAGVTAALHPFRMTRIDLRYVHTRDHATFNTPKTQRDDYAALTVRQGIGENGSVSAEWSTIDAATRDFWVAGSWTFPELDLNVHARYKYENDIQHEFTTELDPFFAVLKKSYAYHNVDLDVSKLFGKHFGADAGVTSRQLANDAREGPFNREFLRGWLTLSTYNWPLEGVDLAVTGEIWEGAADKTRSLGGEIDYRPTDRLRVSAGTYYSLYKFGLVVVDEHQNATTFFLKMRFKVHEAFRLEGRLEYETGDAGEVSTVWLGLTWTF